MAAPDDTGLKNLIDSNIQDAAPGRVRPTKAAFVRYTLYQLIDWVKTAVNGNLSTWYKVGTSNTPATNADDVYRTGKVIVGRSNLDTTGNALQVESFSLASIPWTGGEFIYTQSVDWDTLTAVGTHCIGGNNVWLSTGHGPGLSFPAFAYGTLRVDRGAGGSIVQTYFDNTGYIYYRQKWQTGAWSDWYCLQRPTMLSFPDTAVNRKVMLYGNGTNNDHQFFGFGVNPDTLRYQVQTVSNSHVFYAGASPVSSNELMRITGAGRVGVGTSSPDALLDLGGTTGIKQLIYGAGGSNSYKNGFGTGLGAAPNTFAAFIGPPNGDGISGDTSFSVVAATSSWPYTAYTTRFTVLGSGSVGIGTVAPTSILHLKGATGHQQLRLETPYTPTSSSDVNGQTGQIAWDQNYIYVKVAGGWRRAGLNSW